MVKKRQIEMHDEWVYRSEARTGRKKKENLKENIKTNGKKLIFSGVYLKFRMRMLQRPY